ncbi:Serine/threonine-protein kinase 25 [Phlyctochytrium bullatum]|nr:Serine/threonine-protein kinase 25 [Phlyctochytrium bullatum]
MTTFAHERLLGMVKADAEANNKKVVETSEKAEVNEVKERKVVETINKATNEIVAIKILDLDTDDDEIGDVQKEISVLSRCDSEHITRYHGSYLMGTKLWIVMDFAAGGSLRSILKSGPLEERYIAVIAREVLLALVYLHKSANVIHRDIKAANILLTGNGKVKLCDFGVAGQVSMHSLRRHSFVGTPYWMAPEIIKRAQYDYKADVWSLGITIIELATGNPPFADQDPRRAIFLIPRSRPARLEGNFSAAIKEFISLCLNEEPEERPSAEDLLKSRFIRTSLRGTECLLDILKRHETWKQEHPELANEYHSLGMDDDEESDPELAADDEWVFETLRSSYISLRRSSTRRSTRSIRSVRTNAGGVPSSVVDGAGRVAGIPEDGEGSASSMMDDDDDKGTIKSSMVPAAFLGVERSISEMTLDPLPPTPILPLTPDAKTDGDDFGSTIRSIDRVGRAPAAPSYSSASASRHGPSFSPNPSPAVPPHLQRRRHERSASYGGTVNSIQGLSSGADMGLAAKPTPGQMLPTSGFETSAVDPTLPAPTASPFHPPISERSTSSTVELGKLDPFTGMPLRPAGADPPAPSLPGGPSHVANLFPRPHQQGDPPNPAGAAFLSPRRTGGATGGSGPMSYSAPTTPSRNASSSSSAPSAGTSPLRPPPGGRGAVVSPVRMGRWGAASRVRADPWGATNVGTQGSSSKHQGGNRVSAAERFADASFELGGTVKSLNTALPSAGTASTSGGGGGILPIKFPAFDTEEAGAGLDPRWNDPALLRAEIQSAFVDTVRLLEMLKDVLQENKPLLKAKSMAPAAAAAATAASTSSPKPAAADVHATAKEEGGEGAAGVGAKGVVERLASLVDGFSVSASDVVGSGVGEHQRDEEKPSGPQPASSSEEDRGVAMMGM